MFSTAFKDGIRRACTTCITELKKTYARGARTVVARAFRVIAYHCQLLAEHMNVWCCEVECQAGSVVVSSFSRRLDLVVVGSRKEPPLSDTLASPRSAGTIENVSCEASPTSKDLYLLVFFSLPSNTA